MFEDHSGQNIAEAVVVDVLGNWGLDTLKLVATKTDSGSNFIAALNSFKWIRVSCFGHNLDLAIKHSMWIVSIELLINGVC